MSFLNPGTLRAPSGHVSLDLTYALTHPVPEVLHAHAAALPHRPLFIDVQLRMCSTTDPTNPQTNVVQVLSVRKHVDSDKIAANIWYPRGSTNTFTVTFFASNTVSHTDDILVFLFLWWSQASNRDKDNNVTIHSWKDAMDNLGGKSIALNDFAVVLMDMVMTLVAGTTHTDAINADRIDELTDETELTKALRVCVVQRFVFALKQIMHTVIRSAACAQIPHDDLRIWTRAVLRNKGFALLDALIPWAAYTKARFPGSAAEDVIDCFPRSQWPDHVKGRKAANKFMLTLFPDAHVDAAKVVPVTAVMGATATGAGHGGEGESKGLEEDEAEGTPVAPAPVPELPEASMTAVLGKQFFTGTYLRPVRGTDTYRVAETPDLPSANLASPGMYCIQGKVTKEDVLVLSGGDKNVIPVLLLNSKVGSIIMTNCDGSRKGGFTLHPVRMRDGRPVLTLAKKPLGAKFGERLDLTSAKLTDSAIYMGACAYLVNVYVQKVHKIRKTEASFDIREDVFDVKLGPLL